MGLYPQDNLVAYFEQQLKTETGKFNFIWHKTADGEFPEKCQRVLCCCVIERGLGYTLGTYHPLQIDNVLPKWSLDRTYMKSKVIAWAEIPKYE